MKKSFSGLGTRISLLFASAVAAVGLADKKGKSFNAPEANPIKRSNKSSGGSAKRISRSPETKAWHRLFGGLAVPHPGFLDLDTPSLKTHRSFARGPRPHTWHKTLRLRTAAA